MYKTANKFYSVKTNIKNSFTNKIISKTKKLALSNDKYNDYLDTFSSFTENNIKMKINLDLEYPIIQPIKKKKQKNKHKLSFISIKTKNYLLNQFYSNCKSEHKKIKTEVKQIFSPTEPFDLKTEQKKNFFICENEYYLNKDINYLEYFENRSKNIINNYNFISLRKTPLGKINYDDNNFNNTHTNYFIHKKNVDNILDKSYFAVRHDNKSEVFCLLDSIFCEKDNDEKFIYDEKKFLHHKNELYNYLETQLSTFIHRKKSVNLLSKLNYNYINKTYGKINLQLNSIKIDILNNFSNNLINSIFIPFDLLPLFYLITPEQIGYVLFYLIKADFFSNKNIHQKKTFEALLTKEVIIKNKEILFQFAIEENDESNIMDGLKQNKFLRKKSNNIRFNVLSLSNKNENKILFMNNSRVNLDKFEHIKNQEGKNIEKKLFENNITTLFFPWITPDGGYILKIVMPKVIVKFQNYNKQINNFIDKQLLIFLYKNDFEKWNLYLSHYLFSIKNFRLFLNKMLAYYPKFLKNKTKPKIKYKIIGEKRGDEIKNNSINIKNVNDNKKDNESFNVSSENNNLFQIKNNDDVNILSIYNREFKPSLNDDEYNFLLSDDKFVHLYKLKSYILYVYYCQKFQKPKVYVFNFSFFQMKILFYKSKYNSLEKVLSRLLKICNSKIIFDYSYFDLFKSMNMNEVNNYFSESTTLNNNKNTQSKNNKYNNYNLEKNYEISLKLNTPEFVHLSLPKNPETNMNNNRGWRRKEGRIKLKLIEKLVENDIIHWGKILSENKNDIEAINANNEYTSSKNDRTSTFLVRENTKKMFKYMLQKILNIK